MPRPLIVRLASCPLRLLGPYGCEWAATPALDRFAAGGIVFDSHFASGAIGHWSYAGKVVSFDEFDGDGDIVEWDPFAEWQFPDDWTDELFATLALEMADFDQAFESLLPRAAGRAIALTARSGFPLGEHGVIGPGGSRLHDELVRIPLILAYPDGRMAGDRVDGLTTPQALREIEAGRFTEVESVLTWDPDESAIRTVDSCLILPHAGIDRPTLLYDRPEDRFEVNDLSARQPDRVAELASRIAVARDTMPG
jgi:hypothetical protein